MPRTSARQHTVKQCLIDLGIVSAEFFAFTDCTTRDEEFRAIKKQYFKKALETHPDKGGDAAVFRQIQTSFELLRDLHSGTKQRRKASWLFSESLPDVAVPEEEDGKPSADEKQEEAFDMSEYDYDFSNQETPSWEFYEAAAAEEPPIYHVETAKSGRSRCKQKSKVGKKCDQTADGQESTALVDPSVAPEIIAKGEIRVGWNQQQTGQYGGWCHLRCFRVPFKVR